MQNLQFDKKITYHERNEDRTYTGRTITVLHIGDTRVFGVSECSIKDQFSRKKGNLVSTSRALRFLEVINGTKVRRITEIAKKNFKKGLMGVFNICLI